LLNHFIILLLGSKKVLQHLDQVGLSNLTSDSFSSTDGGDQHYRLEDDIIFSETVDKIVVDEVQKVCLIDYLVPLVGGNVDHGAQELKHEISVFSTLLNHDCVAFKMKNECVMAVRIKLGNISYAFEKKSVSKFTSSGDKFIKLTITSQHISISLISSQVNCQGN
jgi:hypothetical protein